MGWGEAWQAQGHRAGPGGAGGGHGQGIPERWSLGGWGLAPRHGALSPRTLRKGVLLTTGCKGLLGLRGRLQAGTSRSHLYLGVKASLQGAWGPGGQNRDRRQMTEGPGGPRGWGGGPRGSGQEAQSQWGP